MLLRSWVPPLYVPVALGALYLSAKLYFDWSAYQKRTAEIEKRAQEHGTHRAYAEHGGEVDSDEDDYSDILEFEAVFFEWRKLVPPDELVKLTQGAIRRREPPSRWRELLVEAAKSARDEGDYERARDLIKEALEEATCFPAGESKQMVLALARQAEGWLHCSLDLLDIARGHLLTSMQEWSAASDESNPIMYELQLNLARVCCEDDRPGFAEQLAWRAFKLAREIHMPKHKQCAALFLLSLACQRREQSVKASAALKCAMKVARSELREEELREGIFAADDEEGGKEGGGAGRAGGGGSVDGGRAIESALEAAVCFEEAGLLWETVGEDGEEEEEEGGEEGGAGREDMEVRRAIEHDRGWLGWMQQTIGVRRPRWRPGLLVRMAGVREEQGNLVHAQHLLSLAARLLKSRGPRSWRAGGGSGEGTSDAVSEGPEVGFVAEKAQGWSGTGWERDEERSEELGVVILRLAEVRRQLGDQRGAEEVLEEGLAGLESVGARRARTDVRGGAARRPGGGRLANLGLIRGGMLASLARVLIDGEQYVRAEGAIRLGMQEAWAGREMALERGDDRLQERSESLQLQLLALKEKALQLQGREQEAADVHARVLALQETLCLPLQL